MAIYSNYVQRGSNDVTMNTTILATAVLLASVLLESATADPPTKAAYDPSIQATRIGRQYDQFIKGTENQIREMKGFKSRFDPTLVKATRSHRPKQWWFRSPEHKRTEIVALEANLAAMRATRWESAIECNIETMFTEFRVGELALPIDYSTGKPAPIVAAVNSDPDETGRVELDVTWPEYFAVGNVDCRLLILDGSTLKRAKTLRLPTLWVKSIADTPDGQRFVCEFATDDQIRALEREISRLTHPDRHPRRWADLSGTHQIDATLQSYDRKSGLVTLERADRTTVSLPIAKLSPADRELVELTLGSRIVARPPLELGGRDPD